MSPDIDHSTYTFKKIYFCTNKYEWLGVKLLLKVIFGWWFITTTNFFLNSINYFKLNVTYRHLLLHLDNFF